jgi:hypothetical protein
MTDRDAENVSASLLAVAFLFWIAGDVRGTIWCAILGSGLILFALWRSEKP